MSYVSEASELFISLDPNTPFLGPFDYMVIAEWEKQVIPLPLVLEAIRRISQRSVPADRFDRLKQEVKARYTNWLKQTTPVTGH